MAVCMLVCYLFRLVLVCFWSCGCFSPEGSLAIQVLMVAAWRRASTRPLRMSCVMRAYAAIGGRRHLHRSTTIPVRPFGHLKSCHGWVLQQKKLVVFPRLQLWELVLGKGGGGALLPSV